MLLHQIPLPAMFLGRVQLHAWRQAECSEPATVPREYKRQGGDRAALHRHLLAHRTFTEGCVSCNG